MGASWVKLASAVGIASAFCSLIPSCADNNQTIFVRQVQALRAPECIVTSDATALIAPTGFVDAGLATNYVIYPLVGNQLSARGDARQSKAESNRVMIQGAEIELLEPTGSPIALGGVGNPYSVLATGTVDPSSGSDATYGVTEVEVLPPAVLAAYRSQVLAPKGIGASRTVHARIRIFGMTLGNTEVETGEFTYPINVCYGCGVTIPAEAIDTKTSLRNCLGTSTAAQTSKTQCRIGQDYLTDCRSCSGSIPLCTPCLADADCSSMRSQIDPSRTAVCKPGVGFCE